MKLQELVNYEKFYLNMADSTLPLACAYQLNKVYLSIQNDLEFYKRTAQNILNECSELDEDGNIRYTEDKSQVILKKLEHITCM